jgi:hypothetical protein
MCTSGNGLACNPDADGGSGCGSDFWTEKNITCGIQLPCRVLAFTKIFDTCEKYCGLQGHKCSKAFENSAFTCTDILETATCTTRFIDDYETTDMICECDTERVTNEVRVGLEAEALDIWHFGRAAGSDPDDTLTDGVDSAGPSTTVGLVSLLASCVLLVFISK